MNLPEVRNLLLCLMLLAGLSDLLPAQMIAFQREAKIFVADADGTGTRFVCKGTDPDIAPSGDRIAFTMNTGESRFIAVYDILTGKTRVLTEKFGDNSFGPRWSADGKMIAFNHFAGDPTSGPCYWKVAVMTADGSDIHLLRSRTGGDEFSPAWMGNDLIVFQDLRCVYIASLDGIVREMLSFSWLGVAHGATSALRFSPSADGKILFDAGVVTETSSEDGPPSAVFLYDRKSGKTVRVTPRGVHALSPFWLNEDTFLFEGYGASRDIFRMNLGGSGPEKIIGNAGFPSVSGPGSGDLLEANAGRDFSITLAANPTTGYDWELLQGYDENILGFSKKRMIPSKGSPELSGAPLTEEWSFTAIKRGTTALRLVYKRSWDTEIISTMTYVVTVK